MNQYFRAAADEARQKLPQLTQNQEVARLYRKGLKVLSSWAIDREIWLTEAETLRARFDAERGCSSARRVRLMREAKAEMVEKTHPDPYCVAFMPGGTLFMRNPPLPRDVCFPDGDVPEDFPKVEFNPDMSVCKEETGKSAIGSVLIDFTKKNME